MTVEIEKFKKGHNILINGKIEMWVIGSKKNAKKETVKLLKELKS